MRQEAASKTNHQREEVPIPGAISHWPLLASVHLFSDEVTGLGQG